MELLAGARTPGEKEAAETLLSTLACIESTEAIARRAVELRQSLRLKLPDAIVHASAETEGCTLVTRNTRDFPANDPRVRIPYQVAKLPVLLIFSPALPEHQEMGGNLTPRMRRRLANKVPTSEALARGDIVLSPFRSYRPLHWPCHRTSSDASNSSGFSFCVGQAC